MEFTLGTAAKRLRLSKPTVSKFIQRGDIAAVKREDGSYSISGAELARFEANYRRQPEPETKVEEPPASVAGQPEVDAAVLRAQLEGMRERMADMIARAEKAEAEAAAARAEATEAVAREREAWQRVAGLLEGPKAERSGWWAKLTRK